MIQPKPTDYQATDWARAMAECPQDAEWHPEGDVWTHTLMVFEEAQRTIEDLPSEDERCAVMWAALLHDMGKPTCTREEDGRIVSPGHARVGAHMSMEVMEEAGLPGRVRDMAFHLIRLHGRPPWIASRDMELETAALSHFCPGRALHALCLADARGRGGDRTEMLDNIELWRLQAQEMGCLDGGFAFPNDHARFRFYHQRDRAFLHTPLHFEPKATLTVTVGFPGSGKDTWLEKQGDALGEIVSLDELRDAMGIPPDGEQGRVRQEGTRLVKEALGRGRSVVLNSTCLSSQLRDGWGAIAHDYGARFRIVYIDPGHESGGTLKICLGRNLKRPRQVPRDVIQGLMSRLTPPTLAESHELLHV